MNWDQIQGNWKQFSGSIRERWGELTDNEVEAAAGDRDRIEGLIQERYGTTKEEARREVDEWAAGK